MKNVIEFEMVNYKLMQKLCKLTNVFVQNMLDMKEDVEFPIRVTVGDEDESYVVLIKKKLSKRRRKELEEGSDEIVDLDDDEEEEEKPAKLNKKPGKGKASKKAVRKAPPAHATGPIEAPKGEDRPKAPTSGPVTDSMGRKVINNTPVKAMSKNQAKKKKKAKAKAKRKK